MTFIKLAEPDNTAMLLMGASKQGLLVTYIRTMRKMVWSPLEALAPLQMSQYPYVDHPI
jgi:hypothetical protein